MDVNRERCVKVSREMYGVLARYTISEALTIVKSVTCELRQQNVGTNVQSATRVHLSETCEGRWPSAIGDHAMGGEVECDDVGARRKCEDSGSVEDVAL